MGPVAEPAVLQRLIPTTDFGLHLEICQILKVIGTRRSLSYLWMLSVDRNRAVAQRANEAAAAIQARGK